MKALQNSLKLNSAGMGTYFNLGLVYRDLKENKKALDAFKKSIQVNGALTEAYYQIAQIHLTMKNRDLALKFIEKAIGFSPNNLTYQESRKKILAL
jgi:tetratricopeptide (TPR) repeat protein